MEGREKDETPMELIQIRRSTQARTYPLGSVALCDIFSSKTHIQKSRLTNYVEKYSHWRVIYIYINLYISSIYFGGAECTYNTLLILYVHQLRNFNSKCALRPISRSCIFCLLIRKYFFPFSCIIIIINYETSTGISLIGLNALSSFLTLFSFIKSDHLKNINCK